MGKIERQLINMHNKYEQLQEDIEETPRSSKKDEDLLENLLNLEESLNYFKETVE